MKQHLSNFYSVVCDKDDSLRSLIIVENFNCTNK